jgi:hypothetical protein
MTLALGTRRFAHPTKKQGKTLLSHKRTASIVTNCCHAMVLRRAVKIDGMKNRISASLLPQGEGQDEGIEKSGGWLDPDPSPQPSP